jgi:hypothetical protein
MDRHRLDQLSGVVAAGSDSCGGGLGPFRGFGARFDGRRPRIDLIGCRVGIHDSDNGRLGFRGCCGAGHTIVGRFQAREYRPLVRLLGDQHRVCFTVESFEKAAMSAR